MTNDQATTALLAAGYTVTNEDDGRILVTPCAARGHYWPVGCGSIRFGDATAALRFLMNERERELVRASERDTLVDELAEAEAAIDAVPAEDRDGYASACAVRDEAQLRLDDFDAGDKPVLTFHGTAIDYDKTMPTDSTEPRKAP